MSRRLFSIKCKLDGVAYSVPAFCGLWTQISTLSGDALSLKSEADVWQENNEEKTTGKLTAFAIAFAHSDENVKLIIEGRGTCLY